VNPNGAGFNMDRRRQAQEEFGAAVNMTWDTCLMEPDTTWNVDG
jgi:hypothetical protein